MAQVESFYTDLGRRLRWFRERRHLTQQQLGEALEPTATRASIANIEAGKQRVLAHTLVQLASVVGVSLNELLPVRDEIRAEAIREELLQKLELPERQLRKVVDKLTPRRSRRRQ